MDHNSLFFTRVVLWNAASVLLAAFAIWHGFFDLVFRYDPTITLVLISVHVLFLILFLRRSRKLHRLLELIRSDSIWREAARWELEKIEERSRYFTTIANITVAIALIGNALGFVTTFLGIDFTALNDPARIGPALTKVMAGPGMAMLATVTGVSLFIVQIVNCRMLATAISTAKRWNERRKDDPR